MPGKPPRPAAANRASGPSRSRAARLGGSAQELARDLAALPDLPIATLKERWTALYGIPPRRQLSRRILVRAIAYRMQEEVFGGLDPATRRRLEQAARDLAAGRAPSPPAAPLAPGTRLLREWRGVVHEVIVLEHGRVQYRGETWSSLSAVARDITGARWSGPRFFGLKGRSR